MTNIHLNNEKPGPMSEEPGKRTEEESAESTRDEEKLAGGRTPQKQGPGRMHGEEETKQKRGGGDVERDVPEDDESGNKRQGGHAQHETGEEGGRSRQGGRSRNM